MFTSESRRTKRICGIPYSPRLGPVGMFMYDCFVAIGAAMLLLFIAVHQYEKKLIDFEHKAFFLYEV